MIDLLDLFDRSLKMNAVRLADTLHNFGIISDEEFDLLVSEIYEKYGDDLDGNFIDYDDL